MDIYEVIRTRKSVRDWTEKEVPEEILNRVLEAGRLAPSARNRQEWRFVVVQCSKTKKKLVEACRGQKFVGEAPVVIACCAKTDNHIMSCGQPCYTIDVSIAIDHMSLAATAEGLGSCWIGAFYEDQVKSILNIPDEIRVVELLVLGYSPDMSVVEKDRLPLKELVHYEQW